MSLLREDGISTYIGAHVSRDVAETLMKYKDGYWGVELNGGVLENYITPAINTAGMSTAEEILAINKQENLIETSENGFKFFASKSMQSINNLLQQKYIEDKEDNPYFVEEENLFLIFIVPDKTIEEGVNQGKIISLQEQEFEGGDAYVESLFVGCETLKDVMKEVVKNKRDNYSKIIYLGDAKGKDVYDYTLGTKLDMFGHMAKTDKEMQDPIPVEEEIANMDDVDKFIRGEVYEQAGRDAFFRANPDRLKEHEINED